MRGVRWALDLAFRDAVAAFKDGYQDPESVSTGPF